jgi:hypothetical protein
MGKQPVEVGTDVHIYGSIDVSAAELVAAVGCKGRWCAGLAGGHRGLFARLCASVGIGIDPAN